jgi:hypothetical protein
MVRSQLINSLLEEAGHYLNLPYMSNCLKDNKIVKERFLGGKGHWQQLQQQSQKIAQENDLNLKNASKQEIYNLQKKNQIGIDCSGLVTQLLIFYGNLINQKIDLNPRKTSADMLTSSPLSKEITNNQNIKPADLIRQKDGHHLLFVLQKKGQIIKYIESSQEKRGVKYGQFNLSDKTFPNQGIYRLLLFD